MKDRKGYRKIEVDAVKWQYRITQQNVIAYSELDKRLCEHVSDVMNMNPSDVEHDQDKRSFRITPENIANWIRKF